MRRLLLLCFLLLPITLRAQDNAYVQGVRQYAAWVDSLSDHDGYLDRGWDRDVEEGPVILTIDQQATIPGAPVTTRSLEGGASTETMHSKRNDSTFCILYHCNVPTNIYKRYYYRQQQLVYTVITLRSENASERWYSQETFYRDGQPVAVYEAQTSEATPYCYLVDFAAYNDGMQQWEAHRKKPTK